MALQEHITSTLLLLAEEYKRDAESHMQTAEGKNDLTIGEIEVLGSFLTVNVVGGAWAAMDEMGTGSLMDKSNPALDKYIASQAWNPYRSKSDTTIRTRDPGPYTNIFGETQVSKATKGGIDLEKILRNTEILNSLIGYHASGKMGLVKEPEILLLYPSRAMQTAAEWLKVKRLREKWQESLRAFPWGRFFVVTKD